MSRARDIIRRAGTSGYHVCRETGIVFGKTGKPMSGAIAKNGYFYVTLIIEGLTRPSKGTAVAKHQMVAFAKYGEDAFKDGIEIRHLDGDRQNNHPCNLALGTRQDNILDMTPEARSKRNLGKPNRHQRKVAWPDVTRIRAIYDRGLVRGECKELADELGVCKSTISSIGRKSKYHAPPN